MAEWDKLIDEAIAQYQIIFVNHLGDRRLPCEIDSSVFVCHGMDEIQLCAYCLANNENLLGKLQWRIEKKEKRYYFYPSADKEFQDALTNMKDIYPECKVRGNYLKDGNLTSVYRICEGGRESEKKSCSLIIDMIFHMNRRGRSKEELDTFIALFSCVHIEILRGFLLKAESYMRNLDSTEQRLFLSEIVNIMHMVLTIRKRINGDNPDEKICEELKKSSAKIIAIVHDKREPKAIRDNFVQEFDFKMCETFSTSTAWRYKGKIRGKNCRDLFRSLILMCFPMVSFDSIRGVDIIEAGLNDVRQAQELLNTEEN